MQLENELPRDERSGTWGLRFDQDLA